MEEKELGKKIASGMVWRFGERITAQLVSFVVSIVLARLLMPSDYGVVAIVYIFIGIADVFVTSGISTSLIQKKDATELDFSTMLYCSLALAGVLYLVLFLCAPLLADFYNEPLLTPVVRVLALKLPISGFNSVQNAYVSRRMEFKKFFFATLGGTIVSAVVGIAMAYHGFGVWALVAQYLTNSTIDTIVLFFTIEWKPRAEFSWKAAKPLWSYGWKILVTDLIGQIFNQLQSFIIGKQYTSADLAYYTQGRKFPDMVNNNISSTLTAVLFPGMSRTDSYEEIRKVRRRALKLLEFILFPLMIGLAAIANTFVNTVLTPKWGPCVPFIWIYCIDALIGILGTTLIQELKAIGRSDVTMKLEFIKKPVCLLIIIASMQFGVFGIAIASLVMEVVAFIFNVIPVKKLIGFDFKILLKDMASPIIMSCIMGVVVVLISLVDFNGWIKLLVEICVGGVIYLGLAKLTKSDSLIFLENMLKQKLSARKA